MTSEILRYLKLSYVPRILFPLAFSIYLPLTFFFPAVYIRYVLIHGFYSYLIE